MMPNTFKRFLCAVMALMMLVALLPAGVITAEAADSKEIVDAAVIFTDLHTKEGDYKENTLKSTLTAVKNAGLPVSSVTSGGDAFSVNEDNSSSKLKLSNYYLRYSSGNVSLNRSATTTYCFIEE